MKALAILLCLSSLVLAESKTVTVEPGLVEIGREYDTQLGEDGLPAWGVAWQPMQPLTLPYKEYWVRDGEHFKPVCVLSLSKPGTYVVLASCSHFAERTIRTDTWTITVKGDPEPDPGPKPPNPKPDPLSAVAKKVKELARPIPKARCSELADVFETVSSMIAAGGIKSTFAAMQEIQARTKEIELPDASRPLLEYLTEYFQVNVDKSLDKAEDSLLEVAKGLRAR